MVINILYIFRIFVYLFKYNIRICDNFYSNLVIWVNNLVYLIDFVVVIYYWSIEMVLEVCIF